MRQTGDMIANRWERLNANPAARDAALAAAWLLLGLALLAAGAYPMWRDIALIPVGGLPLGGGAFVLTLAGMAAIATQRSRHPIAALGAGTAVAAVDLACGGSLGVVIILSDLLYAAMKYAGDRAVRATLVVALSLAALVAGTLLLRRPAHPQAALVAVQLGLLVIVSMTWGWNVRVAGVRARAAMVEQHARESLRLRQRIAHDLHDLVANQIAVAGLHVEAAKLIARAPRTATDASAPRAAPDAGALLRSLDQATRGTEQAHRRLRELIAVLTAVDDLGAIDTHDHLDGEAAAPDRGLAGWADLLPAGRAIAWAGGGAEALRAAVRGLGPARSSVALRSLTELVANAAKHGTGDLRIEVGPGPGEGESLVTLSNARASSGRPAAGTGLGLGGARLLLEGIGAELLLDPRDRAGTPPPRWSVAVRLPAAGATNPSGAPA